MTFSIPFAIAYFYEFGFVSLVVIKRKSQNRLKNKDDMRTITPSDTVPGFKAIIPYKNTRQMSE